MKETMWGMMILTQYNTICDTGIMTLTAYCKSKYFTDKSFKKSSAIIDFTNPNTGTYQTHTDRVSYLMIVL